MTVLPVRTVPDPVLRTPAAPVQPGRADLRQLVADMFATMHDVGGVGLAAPQVGVGLRIFTFDVDGDRGHVINPELSVSGDLVTEPGEGCLSVPGLRYHPERHAQAFVRGVDLDGQPVEFRGEDLLARCFQHEYDHLEGTLFVDRLTGQDRTEARRRMRSPDYGAVTRRTYAERSSTVGSSFGAVASGVGRTTR